MDAMVMTIVLASMIAVGAVVRRALTSDFLDYDVDLTQAFRELAREFEGRRIP
jgi:hypothetical protein